MLPAQTRQYWQSAACGLLILASCIEDDESQNPDDFTLSTASDTTSDTNASDSTSTDSSSNDSTTTQSASPCVPRTSDVQIERPVYDTWIPVILPGATCADKTPYRFFVRYSATSNDLMLTFEPGGACWSYETCTSTGKLSASNLTQVPEDYMQTQAGARNLAYPLLGDPAVAPDIITGVANQVFLPYCTGDTHIGNIVATYLSQDSSQEIEIAHVGASNTAAALAWMRAEFPDIPRLTVSGCSAGSLGALIHYPQIRKVLANPSAGETCGLLLADSGPLLVATDNAAFQTSLRKIWHADETLFAASQQLATPLHDVDLNADPEALYDALARAYPSDRLTFSGFLMDLTMPAFLYADPNSVIPEISELRRRWQLDLDRLLSRLDTTSNWSYFLSDFRTDSCSHCTSILPLDHVVQVLLGQVGPFFGTELATPTGSQMDYGQFVSQLYHPENPVLRLQEARDASMDFTTQQVQKCLEEGSMQALRQARWWSR